MAAEDPVKSLLPVLQRADELQKHDPLVSYYCRLYAMEQGLKIPSQERSKETNDLLKSLMVQLEKDKAHIKRSQDDPLYVEGFALRVFDKADKQDRAGRADISTAKAFYAAGIFLEVCRQFGSLASELDQKQKYAVWKAGDIRKALKEGRAPTPGPPGGDASTQGMYASPATAAAPGAPPPPTSGLLGSGVPTAGAPGAPLGGAPAPPALDAFGLPAAPTTVPGGAPAAGPVPGLWSPQGGGAYAPPQSQPSGPYPVAYPVNPSASFGNGLPNGQPLHPPSTYPRSTSGAAPFSLGHIQSPAPSAASAPPSASRQYPGASSVRALGPSGNALDAAFGSAAPTAPPSLGGHADAHAPPTLQGWGYGGGPPSYGAAPGPSLVPSASASPAQSHSVAASPVPSHGGASASPAGTASSSTSAGSQPPGKVAEAHKAARFAVSALAFDDVPTAIEYLRKSLDLLTK